VAKRKQRLKRLPPEYYRGFAWVHWTLTSEDRQQGWLDALFLYKFRELLTHVAFRDRIACPIFCLMPDHVHLLWCGLTETSDQRLAMRHLRTDMNDCLKRIGYELQKQPYDHVLKDEELERDAIESLVEYIARNPERKGLVGEDEFAVYPYTGCLLPGYQQIRLFEPHSWDRVWRTLAFLRRTECFRIPDPNRDKP
jgi:REP element-mobilizing transposase RayT